MLHKTSIIFPTRATFLLKLSYTQSTENIRSDAFRYCFQNGLHISGFFKIKEDSPVPEEDYTNNILCNISEKCQEEGDIVLFTNFKLPLSSFTVINEAIKTGKLRVCDWNF